MEIKGDDIVFSTGRTKYANNGIIGISPDCETIYGGYDGYVHSPQTMNTQG